MRLIVRNMKKNIDNKTVLENISYSFNHGMVYGLIGNKDSGKSTFFKCISGECSIDEGYIRLEADWKEHKIKYSDFGIVSDICTVPEYVTGYELFECYKDIHPEYIEEGKNADYYFNQIGLSSNMRDRLIKDYSLADKKRIQKLAVLLTKPSVILLDEPFVNHGKNKYKELKTFIENLKDRIIIIATDNADIAEELCDECIYLNNGRISTLPVGEIRKQMNSDGEDNNV